MFEGVIPNRPLQCKSIYCHCVLVGQTLAEGSVFLLHMPMDHATRGGSTPSHPVGTYHLLVLGTRKERTKKEK
jgi:hypothetical protein